MVADEADVDVEPGVREDAEAPVPAAVEVEGVAVAGEQGSRQEVHGKMSHARSLYSRRCTFIVGAIYAYTLHYL